jgi:hypothetical protein
MQIILRPHPNDKRVMQWKKLANRYKATYSNSTITSSFEFLNTVDAIIACESNIHLEAAMMNVLPIYFNFQIFDIYNDVYGFISNNLVYNCEKSLNELKDYLIRFSFEKPSVIKKVSYYMGTSNTKFYGKSTDLITKLLKEIKTDSIDFSIWKDVKLKGCGQVFELRQN